MSNFLSATSLVGYGITACIFGLCALLKTFWRSDPKYKHYLSWIFVLSCIWAAAVFCAVFYASELLYWSAIGLDGVRLSVWSVFLLRLRFPENSLLPGMNFVQRRFVVVCISLLILCLIAVFGASNWLVQTNWVWLLFLSISIQLLVILEQLFRYSSSDTKWCLKPLVIGLGAILIFDLYFFSDALLFRHLDEDAFAVRGLVNCVAIPMLALTTARTRGWSAKFELSQQITFHSVALIGAGIYLLFVAAGGYYVRYFGGEWGRVFQIGLLFVSLIALAFFVLSGTIRSKIRVLLGKHLFAYRYDYREEWLKFTESLSASGELNDVGNNVVLALARMVESPSGALWITSRDEEYFSQLCRWNMPAIEINSPRHASLVDFLARTGWVINLEEFRVNPAKYSTLQFPDWLGAIPNAWLIIPLLSGSEVIGFCILGTSRAHFDLNWEVLDLLKTAGRQAGVYLAQVIATEALVENKKFEAFNKMSAFIIHDLKNIIAQLSLMTKNAERHKGNPEFQSDMIMTVEHSVERMRQLMLQLRDGSVPSSPQKGVNLKSLIHDLLKTKRVLGQCIEFKDCPQSVNVLGHQEKLERVIGHVLQNAIDATIEQGSVRVDLDTDIDVAIISISDTGVGMSADFVRDKLFKPFNTTKNTGMGIGAYESFQYIRDLGGKIEVVSELNKGTTVTIRIPLTTKIAGDHTPAVERIRL